MGSPTDDAQRPPTGRSGGTGRSGARSTSLVALILAVVVSACGGSDAVREGAASFPMPTPMAPSYEDGPSGPSGTLDAEFGRGDHSGTDRAVVREAAIDLVVDDAATAIDAAEALAVALGGSVASSTRSRDEDGTVWGSLTLRVPADRIEELVDGLDALARAVPFRSIDELDVTLQLSDIDAQLRNLRAFETELRSLLTEVRERDGTVEGLVAVAESLRRVRTEIDMIESRRIQLADRVELSTVRVTVRQARSTTPVVGTWDLPGVVRDAAAATVRLGQLVVEGLIWSIMTGLPVLIVTLVAWRSGRALRRRRQDRAGAPPTGDGLGDGAAVRHGG